MFGGYFSTDSGVLARMRADFTNYFGCQIGPTQLHSFDRCTLNCCSGKTLRRFGRQKSDLRYKDRFVRYLICSF